MLIASKASEWSLRTHNKKEEWATYNNARYVKI